jgi:hypothetical protein
VASGVDVAGAAGSRLAHCRPGRRAVEEPLADSVRSVLSAAIANRAPPKPIFKRSRSAWRTFVARRDERAAEEADRRARHASRVSRDTLVRRAPGRPRAVADAGPLSKSKAAFESTRSALPGRAASRR